MHCTKDAPSCSCLLPASSDPRQQVIRDPHCPPARPPARPPACLPDASALPLPSAPFFGPARLREARAEQGLARRQAALAVQLTARPADVGPAQEHGGVHADGGGAAAAEVHFRDGPRRLLSRSAHHRGDASCPAHTDRRREGARAPPAVRRAGDARPPGRPPRDRRGPPRLHELNIPASVSDQFLRMIAALLRDYLNALGPSHASMEAWEMPAELMKRVQRRAAADAHRRAAAVLPPRAARPRVVLWHVPPGGPDVGVRLVRAWPLEHNPGEVSRMERSVQNVHQQKGEHAAALDLMRWVEGRNCSARAPTLSGGARSTSRCCATPPRSAPRHEARRRLLVGRFGHGDPRPRRDRLPAAASQYCCYRSQLTLGGAAPEHHHKRGGDPPRRPGRRLRPARADRAPRLLDSTAADGWGTPSCRSASGGCSSPTSRRRAARRSG